MTTETEIGRYPIDHCAAMVLGWAGLPGGYEPGGFVSKVLDAFACADSDGFDRLRSAFPNLGAAMQLYKHHDHGVVILRETVENQADTFPEGV